MREAPLILVVDDVPDNVEILQMRLESQGYEVVTAGDGVEALEQTRELLPDLILLDINMPGCGGVQTCREIRSQMLDVGVVMVSVRDGESDLVQALEGLGPGAQLRVYCSDDEVSLPLGFVFEGDVTCVTGKPSRADFAGFEGHSQECGRSDRDRWPDRFPGDAVATGEERRQDHGRETLLDDR